MTVERFLLGAAVVLAGLALFQALGSNRLDSGQAALAPGDLLPDPVAFASRNCWMGYFVDPDCRYCSDLLDRVHGREDIRWIFGGDSAKIDSAVEHYGLTEEQTRIVVSYEEGAHPFRTWGIPGVPTRVVVDGNRVAHVALGGEAIAPDSVDRLCR